MHLYAVEAPIKISERLHILFCRDHVRILIPEGLMRLSIFLSVLFSEPTHSVGGGGMGQSKEGSRIKRTLDFDSDDLGGHF